MDVGIDSDEYFELTWYDLQLRIQRFNRIEKKEQFLEEMNWARFRIQVADFRTANGKKKVNPKDIMKLSIDDVKSPEKLEVPDMDAAKKRFGSKVKNKKNQDGK